MWLFAAAQQAYLALKWGGRPLTRSGGGRVGWHLLRACRNDPHPARFHSTSPFQGEVKRACGPFTYPKPHMRLRRDKPDPIAERRDWRVI